MRVMVSVLTLVLGATLAGCDDDSGEKDSGTVDTDTDTTGEDTDTDGGTETDTDTVTEVVCEYPATWDGMNQFFADNCDLCHADANGAGRLDLRAQVQAEVEAGGVNLVILNNAEESQLWKVISGTGVPQMPTTGLLPESEICHVEEWINAGAPI